MSKQCCSCGSIEENNVRFCHLCGSSDFVLSSATGSEPTNFTPETNFGQGFEQPGSRNCQPMNEHTTSIKKKSNKRVIASIICSVVIITTISGILDAVMKNNRTGYYSNDISSLVSESQFSRGTLVGSTYVSKWANLKIKLPSHFTKKETPTTQDSQNVVFDLCMTDTDAPQTILIGYEKLPDYPKYTIEDYIDVFANEVTGGSESMRVINATRTVTIFDQEWHVIDVESVVNATKVYQSNFLKQVDNRIVIVSITSRTIDDNDALAMTMQPSE